MGKPLSQYLFYHSFKIVFIVCYMAADMFDPTLKKVICGLLLVFSLAFGFIGLVMFSLRPSADHMKYAESTAGRLNDTPACTVFKQRILEAGKGSPSNAATGYQIITAYEEAKKNGCAKSQQALVVGTATPTEKPSSGYLWLLWLVPFAVVAGVLKTPWFKGAFGEMLVRLLAWIFLDKAEYRAIHDVTLPTPEGTTQIDHIFVSAYGVFVVETKNYAGWIFGDENQPSWTQKIFKVAHTFQNPLRQNYKHVKALEEAFGIPFEKIHSVIVFTGGSSFKTPMPDNVTYAGGYISYIKSKTQVLFSLSEVESIFEAIVLGRIKPCLATTRVHVQNLQSRKEMESEVLCPRCGSEMVMRASKKGGNSGGEFWGCSQFPKCRGTRNI